MRSIFIFELVADVACQVEGTTVQVHLSTHPPTHTPNMFSWFPIFFPLKEPVYCPAGKPLCMDMWRCTAYHKVWYEWAVTQPSVTQIHNPTGRSYHVGL